MCKGCNTKAIFFNRLFAENHDKILLKIERVDKSIPPAFLRSKVPTGSQPRMPIKYKNTFWLFICLMSIIFWSGRSYGAYFEIEDILDALKKEIQLSVSSDKSSNGEVELEVVGSDYNDPVQSKITQSYHRIYLSFYPNDFFTFPAELSSGLVEVINNAINSLNKSYLNPPNFNFDTFTFDIVFAIVKWKNGEIKFVTTNLGHLISSSIPTHRLTVHMSITNSSNS
jgi:hypothetical protein